MSHMLSMFDEQGSGVVQRDPPHLTHGLSLQSQGIHGPVRLVIGTARHELLHVLVGAKLVGQVAQPVYARHGQRLPTPLYVKNIIYIALDGPLLQRVHIRGEFKAPPVVIYAPITSFV
jgi:hypothetical protein